MSIKDQLGNASTLVKSIAALIALLPGVAILLGLVDIPPSIVALLKYTSVLMGITIVITVLLLSDKIKKMKTSLAAMVIVGCALSGTILAVSYFTFAQNHVVVVQGNSDVEHHVVPLRPSQEIVQLINPYQGDYVEALQTSVQREQLAEAMQRESGGAIAAIVALLLSAQALGITAIVLGAWKLTSIDE